MKILHNNIEILNIQVDDSSYRSKYLSGRIVSMRTRPTRSKSPRA